jgi:hypothetical protein
MSLSRERRYVPARINSRLSRRSLPREGEGKFMTVFAREEVRRRAETPFDPWPQQGKSLKDRVLPFDRDEVRSRRMLGEFLKESLATPRIVVNAAENPRGGSHRAVSATGLYLQVLHRPNHYFYRTA